MPREAEKIDFEIIHHLPNQLGECPVWDDRENLLYWVDIKARPGFDVHPIQQVFTVIPDRAFPELVGKVVDDFKIDFFGFSGHDFGRIRFMLLRRGSVNTKTLIRAIYFSSSLCQTQAGVFSSIVV